MDTDAITRWKNSTRWLTVGISITTVLLLLYNTLLFLPPRGDRGLQGGSMGLVLALSLFVLLLCYFGIMNYCRGLKRFATHFEKGGKRALWMIRWSCLLALAGVLVQLLMFRIVPFRALSVGQIIVGNILWLAATVLGIVGFLGLATVRHLSHDGRKGAAHLVWVLLLLFIDACLVSYVLQQNEGGTLPIKLLAIAVNVAATCFFFKQWKRILTPPAASDADDTGQPEADTSATTTDSAANRPDHTSKPQA